MRRALVADALGVICGDIGTDPIHTSRECLEAGGGTASPEAVLGLLSLVFRALLGLVVHSETDQRRRTALLMVGLAGAALFFGDGATAPAISVLSAVEGLEAAAPLLKFYVVSIAITVLVGLLAVESRGSEHIGGYLSAQAEAVQQGGARAALGRTPEHWASGKGGKRFTDLVEHGGPLGRARNCAHRASLPASEPPPVVVAVPKRR